MEKRILKSIVWLAAFAPFAASAQMDELADNHAAVPTLLKEYGKSSDVVFQAFELVSKNNLSEANSNGDSQFDAVVTEDGTLATVLGDQIYEIESISVTGPINEADFNTLWDSSFNGKLKIINLENATIKYGVIPEYAFFHINEQVDWDTWIITITPLEKVVLPDNVTEIEEDAFAYNTRLAEINFPKALRYIGKSAFTDCISLTSEQLVFPEGLEKLDEQAFYQCRGLNGAIKLPSTLTWIDASVFYNCRISDINIPVHLEFLGCFAFAGSRFNKAILPDDCYLCPHGCQFYNNWELTEVHLPDNLQFVPPQVVDGCIKLTKANVPSRAVDIGEFAYSGTSITEINFPPTLQTIGQDAFQTCDELQSIVLPPALCEIGNRAFVCRGLKSLYCMATEPPASTPAQGYEPEDRTPFAEVDASILVYIPIGTKQKYMGAVGWEHFTNFIETNDFPYAGIDSVTVGGTKQDNDTYDLSGRKVKTPVHGNIYIRNGKKILLLQ